MTTLADRPRCAFADNGKPCGRFATADGLCYFHSPQWSDEEKQQARERGGKRGTVLPPETPDARLRTEEDCQALMEQTMNQLRRGEIAPPVADSIFRGLNTAKRIVESVSIGKRLNAVERVLRRQGRRR